MLTHAVQWVEQCHYMKLGRAFANMADMGVARSL